MNSAATYSANATTSKVSSTPPWQGIAIGRHQLAPGEFDDYVSPVYTVDVHLSHPYHLEWKQGNRYRRTAMTAGALCIGPIQEPLAMRWNEHLDLIRASLSPAVLASTADSMKVRGEITIPERHGDFDNQIAPICQTLWAEAQAGYPLGRVFGESLGTALASCLLQRYSAVSTTIPSPGKLSARSWKTLQEFVEEQLQNDISLEEMAQIAGLSPYYFSRRFKETSGMSPHQYLIARRVERARQLMSDADLPLAQIAVQSGFADQSHLTRHMKRIFGQTPNALMPRRNRHKSIQ